MKYNSYLKKQKRYKIIIKAIQVLIILIFISLWELLSSHNIINPFIFSSPSKIIKGIYELYISHNLFNHIFSTLYEIIIAFVLGFIISFILAIILYSNKIINNILDPFITTINSLPKVALGPVLIIWFGASNQSIIIMALLINVIVSTISLYTGFISVNKYYLFLFRSLNANKLKTLLYLVIPSSVNNIISSLKLNISMTLIGLLPLVGEKLFFNKCYSRY